MRNVFATREEAGEALAGRIAALGLGDPVVLALPRGGVPVALPVARRLGAPLDLLMVRKIGMPGHAETAAGAVVDGAAPQSVFNTGLIASRGLSEADFAGAVAAELAEIERRRAHYLGGRPPVAVEGRDAVLVDDGIATGATVRAALAGLRLKGPRTIVLAVPVAPQSALAALAPLVDRTVCLLTPRPFFAVGAHYDRFDQVGDDAVVAMLAAADTERKDGR